MTMTGLKGSAKFSFHADALNHSWLSEARDKLVNEQIIDGNQRIIQSVPIGPLPWHGMTIRFADNLLRKEGHGLDHIDGTVIALEAPSLGQVLEVGLILATGLGVNVKGGQFAIGEVGSAGRALLVVGRYVEQDTFSAKLELNAKLA